MFSPAANCPLPAPPHNAFIVRIWLGIITSTFKMLTEMSPSAGVLGSAISSPTVTLSYAAMTLADESVNSILTGSAGGEISMHENSALSEMALHAFPVKVNWMDWAGSVVQVRASCPEAYPSQSKPFGAVQLKKALTLHGKSTVGWRTGGPTAVGVPTGPWVGVSLGTGVGSRVGGGTGLSVGSGVGPSGGVTAMMPAMKILAEQNPLWIPPLSRTF
mmetsp:Transcript_14308/g.41958  ORF Transcript_14308/g.41958 Transcript_14308/m.41958 type:complete len:217 (-) Transcript_14308:1064-1714(-)